MGKLLLKYDEWREESRMKSENYFRENFGIIDFVERAWDILVSYECEFYFNVWILRSSKYESRLFAKSGEQSTQDCNIINGEIKIEDIHFNDWEDIFAHLDLGGEFQVDIITDIDDDQDEIQDILKRMESDFDNVNISSMGLARGGSIINCRNVK